LALAKFPDVIAFSMDVPTELEPDCSLLTVLHIALLGFDPLTLAVEWFFVLCTAAEAAVSGARASVTPSTPTHIPTHLDRCITVATSEFVCFSHVTAPVATSPGTRRPVAVHAGASA
jgi:hypothetical protein